MYTVVLYRPGHYQERDEPYDPLFCLVSINHTGGATMGLLLPHVVYEVYSLPVETPERN